jgi:putative ABC transport system substrate-binding protein
VAIAYRWAVGHYDRLPALAADLVGRHVAVLVTAGGTRTVITAKAATSTIPIVFIAGCAVVESGLVASLGRPGGNGTGASIFVSELIAKRMELLHELALKAAVIAMLVDPDRLASNSWAR